MHETTSQVHQKPISFNNADNPVTILLIYSRRRIELVGKKSNFIPLALRIRQHLQLLM
jgi:hypothetical protein